MHVRHWGAMLAVMVLMSVLVFPGAPALQAAEIAEVEPNNTAESAQALTNIGLANPVAARINQGGDVDWYRFEAVAGRTYVAELFNVSSSIGQGFRRYTCNGDYGSYDGLSLFAFDPRDDSTLAGACESNSGGNTLVVLTFTARNTGPIRLRVFANPSNVQGDYQLRILPKYGEDGAAWDATTFEPNNTSATAALVEPGRTNAITARVEERNSIYATNSGDVDWYRFNAIAGRTYVVELFNVSRSLGQGFSRYTCNGDYGSYSGLTLFAYDTVNNSQIAAVCEPSNGGDTLSTIAFKVENTGPVTLRVYPNVSTAIGQYSLRVLPYYDEAGADWDVTTFEPNNRQENAALIRVGRNNSIRAAIEERNSIYATNSGDIDWYRFQAVQGEEYIVEVSNVSPGLNQGFYRYTCAGDYGSYSGLALFAYDVETQATLVSRCRPNGTGGVHTTVTFTAPSTGAVTLRMFPNVPTTLGEYTLNVRLADEPAPAPDGRRIYLPLLRR